MAQRVDSPSFSMFRSPADKTFFKRMTMVILIAEIVVVGVCYAVFGEPYWLVMAIMSGAAVFAAVIGFSVLFGPDYNVFSPWPSSLPRPLPTRRGSEYPGYGPHEDPHERFIRQREADQRMARDEIAGKWLGLAEQGKPDKIAPGSGRSAYLMWTFGPLVAVILVIALLIGGGIDVAP